MDATAFGQELDVSAIPDGFLPYDVIVIVKGVTAEGTVGVFECASPGLSTWEAIGMLTVCSDALRDALRDV